MKGISITGGLLFSVLLSGCVGLSLRVSTPYQPSQGQNFTYEVVDKAGTSEEALTTMRDRLNDQLGAAGQLAQSAAGATRTVEIVITNYHMRPGAAKFWVGSLAGSDNILTSVVVKDAKTETVLSRFEAESQYSSSWVFSRGLIQGHADKLVNYLKTGQP
jgi:hypothetical protein